MSSNKSASWLTKFVPALILLSAAVFLVTLRNRPVPTIDGAVYASVARNIVNSGSWYPLHYIDHIFAEHPPLYVWSIAASFKIFGVNDFAANFPMHFFSFLVVIMTALIGRRAGLSRGVSLAAAITLCATRDFVLSSVRGYIEPIMEFWIYFGMYCVFTQFHKKNLIWSMLAGISIFLAWLSKGPPVLWPTLFFGFLLLWKRTSLHIRIFRFTTYFTTLFVTFTTLYFCITNFDVENTFQFYFHKQVLGSAMTGRGGAQTFEPFYFVNILKQYYWPWLPFLIIAFWIALLEFLFGNKSKKQIPGLDLPAEELFPKPFPSWVYAVFGMGFFVGFSIVKWKFWYYIAPAYPAFSLCIASTLYHRIAGVFERPLFFKVVCLASLCWGALLSIFPISTWKDRVPEVTAFTQTIANSPKEYAVYFLNPKRDHNLIATSGEWYFNKPVQKISDLSGVSSIPKNSWLMISEDLFEECKKTNERCRKATLIQSHEHSELVMIH